MFNVYRLKADNRQPLPVIMLQIMNKIDELINLLYKIYLMLQNFHEHQEKYLSTVHEQHLTRQEVKDYLGISESTYKRKVKDGSLKPIKMPGGDRFSKNQLMTEFEESKRRGRI